MKTSRFLQTIFVASWGPLIGCGPGKEPEKPTFPTATNTALVGTPGCLGDSFFVEVPELEPTPCGDFRGLLTGRIQREFEAAYCTWSAGRFHSCDWDPPTGSYRKSGVSVAVEPVFDPTGRRGEQACLVHDGHLRFFRVRFFEPGGGRPLVVPEDRICHAVSLIREAAQREIQECDAPALCHAESSNTTRKPELYVGRECPLVPLEAAAALVPESPAATWHLDRLGVGMSTPSGAGVNVALIDTGVDPLLLGDPRILRKGAAGDLHGEQYRFPDPDGTGQPRHQHGSYMALAIRSLAPKAQIYSLRVFDTDGVATTLSVARAIEASVMEITAPRIINLSLGWTGEYGSRRRVAGPIVKFVGDEEEMRAEEEACDSHEDPLGESVKFALALARHTPETLAVAASGNRPHPNTRDSHAAEFRVCDIPAGGKTCQDKEMPPDPPDLFFPAWWSVDKGKINPFTRETAEAGLALAAGPLNPDDGRSALSPRGTLVPLLAPGELVYVDLPVGVDRRGVRVPEEAGHCHDIPAGTLGLPKAISGTSVSAALVTGVATSLLSSWRESGGHPLDARDLEWLIYTTGLSTAEAAPAAGVPSRRPSLCRALSWSSSTRCREALTQCMTAGGSLTLTSTLGECVAIQAACEWDTAGSCPAPRVERVDWPATYDGKPCGGATSIWRAGERPPGQLRERDRLVAGKLGPQPQNGGCPDCRLKADPFPGMLTGFLDIELNSDLAPGTTFTAPMLNVYAPDGNGKLQLMHSTMLFEDGVGTADWKPGYQAKITGIALHESVTAPGARAELHMKIVPPGGQPTLDASPLRLIIE